MKLADGLMNTGALLLTETSATGTTVVSTAGLVLFAGLGSFTELLAVAEFERLAPFAGAVTVRTRFVVVPAGKLPRFHSTCPALSAPPPVAATNVTPVGKLSATDKFVATDGPKFVTEIV